MKNEICPVCGKSSNKYGWFAYCFVGDNGYKRTHIDYVCDNCITRLLTEINYLQLTNKGFMEQIGIVKKKGKLEL